MQPHQERVIQELRELNEKRVKLNAFRTPRQGLPKVELTAVVVRDGKLYKKVLPVRAMAAANFQIFTEDNINFIISNPDSVEQQFPQK